MLAKNFPAKNKQNFKIHRINVNRTYINYIKTAETACLKLRLEDS